MKTSPLPFFYELRAPLPFFYELRGVQYTHTRARRRLTIQYTHSLKLGCTAST